MSKEEQVYGRVTLDNGAYIGGITLEEVEEIATDMMDYEQSLYDMVGDIAVEATILRDLVARIKHLEAKVGDSES